MGQALAATLTELEVVDEAKLKKAKDDLQFLQSMIDAKLDKYAAELNEYNFPYNEFC